MGYMFFSADIYPRKDCGKYPGFPKIITIDLWYFIVPHDNIESKVFFTCSKHRYVPSIT